MVSVIIPTFNREKCIAKSIFSVLNQTYRDIELIIVDDGSMDGTADIVQSINDTRLKYIWQANQGACAARNRGIAESIGEFIAFQDSDDLWREDKLALQLEPLIKNGADVVFCQTIMHGKHGGEETVFPNLADGFVDRKDLIGSSIVSTQTMLMKRNVAISYAFDISMPRLQDYEWVMRSSATARFYIIAKTLVDRFLLEDSITNLKRISDACLIILEKNRIILDEFSDGRIKILKDIAAGLELSGESGVKYFREAYTLRPTLYLALQVLASKMHLYRIAHHITHRLRNNS